MPRPKKIVPVVEKNMIEDLDVSIVDEIEVFETQLTIDLNSEKTLTYKVNEINRIEKANLILTFPNNIVAGMFGFSDKEFFEVEETDKAVPKVSF